MDSKSILTAMRPVVAGIADAEQRKAVADALVKALTPQKANDAEKIVNAMKDMAPKKATVDLDEIQNAYNQLNPHTRKEAK